ncbi:MAG: hypothetical protein ABGZ53_32825 [Fuerstiella sp.]
MKLFWRKQPAPKPAPLPEPTVDEAAERDAVRAEFAEFVVLFGPAMACTYAKEGLSMLDAARAEVVRLQGIVELRDVQLAERNSELGPLL